MPTAPLPGDIAGPSVDELFYDLVWADAELVAAEFDAIIAAEWPEPPTRRPAGRGAAGHPANEKAPAPTDADPHAGRRERDRDIDASARQRSPPPTAHPTVRPNRDGPRTGRR